MASGPQNRHEDEALRWALRSFGGRGAFYPEDWKKGREKKEPADIAWINKDCALLVYHTACERHDGSKETVEDTKARIEHNFDQARGAMRLWRDFPQPLTGNVGDGRVSLDLGRARKVVLSVVDSPHSVFCAYPQERERLGVDLAVNVPHSFILAAAQMRLPIIDLCYLLAGLEITDDWITASDMIQLVTQYLKHGRMESWRAHRALSNGPCPSLDCITAAERIVSKCFHLPSHFPVGEEPDDDEERSLQQRQLANSLFSDLPWIAQCNITLTLAEAEAHLRRGRLAACYAFLPQYICLLSIIPSFLEPSAVKMLMRWADLGELPDLPPQVAIIQDKFSGSLSITQSRGREETPTLLHDLLKGFADSGYKTWPPFPSYSNEERARVVEVLNTRVFSGLGQAGV